MSYLPAPSSDVLNKICHGGGDKGQNGNPSLGRVDAKISIHPVTPNFVCKTLGVLLDLYPPNTADRNLEKKTDITAA